MPAQTFTLIFVGLLLATLSLRFWLTSRQIRHVIAHRNAVPAQFAERIALSAHQKAADYTVAKGKFGLLSMGMNAAVLIGYTLMGGRACSTSCPLPPPSPPSPP